MIVLISVSLKYETSEKFGKPSSTGGVVLVLMCTVPPMMNPPGAS